MQETYFETFIEALANCRDRDGVLGEEGLVYPPRDDSNYHATPKNAITFGKMGVDGVHYAILKIDGQINDHSPVIQISPMDSDAYSLLANSLLEYFSAGCGVSLAKMQSVFDQERNGASSLVEFLKKNFNQERLWGPTRNRSISSYRHLFELNEEA